MRQYDYSALTAALTDEDRLRLGSSWLDRFRAKYIAIGGAFVCAAGLFLWLSGTFISSMTFNGVSGMVMGGGFVNVGSLLMVAGVVLLLVLAVMYGKRELKKRRLRLERFAAANGAIYRYDTPPNGLKGMIFDEGSNREVLDALTFSEGFEIGNYQYVTGSGKNRRTNTYSYVRISFPRHLPNMVLDSKQNNFLGMTNLPDVYNAAQKLQLEGDFNQHFDVYVPAGYERDALYVLTPDVMAMLIDLGGNYDMEVVDNEFYIYYPVHLKLDMPLMVERTITMVARVMDEFGRQVGRYSDERAATQSLGAVVAPEGRRLKRGVNWKIAVAVVIFIAVDVLLFLAPNDYKILLMLAHGALIWSVVIFAVVSSVRRRR